MAVISTLTMFGGLILAAVVISSFTSAFASMDNKRALAGQQLDVIRNYLLLKAVPNDLVRAHDKIEVVLLKEFADHISAECVRDTAVVLRPAGDVGLWIGPKEIAEQA